MLSGFGLLLALRDGPLDCVQLTLFTLFVEGEHSCLFLEVAHPVRVAVLEVGVHNIVYRGVVPVQVLRYLSYRHSVLLVLVDNVDSLIVKNELLRIPGLFGMVRRFWRPVWLTALGGQEVRMIAGDLREGHWRLGELIRLTGSAFDLMGYIGRLGEGR